MFSGLTKYQNYLESFKILGIGLQPQIYQIRIPRHFFFKPTMEKFDAQAWQKNNTQPAGRGKDPCKSPTSLTEKGLWFTF